MNGVLFKLNETRTRLVMIVMANGEERGFMEFERDEARLLLESLQAMVPEITTSYSVTVEPPKSQ